MPSSARFMLACIAAFWLIVPIGLNAGKPVLIKKPNPTHVEKDSMYIPLEKVAGIDEEIDDENFFARPMDLVTDDRGGFFVFDHILEKIFSFGKDLKLRKVFLNLGNGPFEIMKKEPVIQRLYFSHDGHLYVISSFNKKIMSFTREATPIKEIRLPQYHVPQFTPVVDKAGNIYTYSPRNDGIDVLDKNLKIKYTLLNNGEMDKYLIKAPPDNPYPPKGYALNFVTLMYDVLPDGRLLVYVARSSILYIFKEGKLQKQYKIWPERTIPNLLLRIEKFKKRFKNEYIEVNLFNSFFVDKDNESFFYLTTSAKTDEQKLIYRFTLDGRLDNIYYFPFKSIRRILAKRNQLFYGVGESDISIFKIKK